MWRSVLRPFTFLPWLVACAAGQVQGSDVAPAPGGTLTFEAAQEVMRDFAKTHGRAATDSPLRDPQSVADVLEILKRDQLDLFEYGLVFIEKQTDVGARSLHAQLELAWGEAANMTGEAFVESSSRLGERATRVREEGDETAASELDARAREYAAAADALLVVGAEHIKRGGAVAKAVIAAAPDDYQGYRVAADYYRLNHRWEEFKRTLAKLEEIRPDSNGLVFLKGAAAAQRDFDFRTAADFYRQALANDPQFTRAQLVLVLGQEDLGGLYAEFQKLKALNPQHHLVVWTSDTLEADYQDWRARNGAESGN